ncbi:MAG: type II toxin-antitoxin system YafQ family toxin [Dethiobacteria bacterium]|nr:type II toxin-antitoxin system YafQ family toxin [Dethiobacteria bacterium]
MNKVLMISLRTYFYMKKVNYSSQFKKDVRLIIKRGLRVESLHTVMKLQESGKELGPDYKEYKLVVKYNGYLECHISADWLLIYRLTGEQLFFVRTGSHSDLFG